MADPIIKVIVPNNNELTKNPDDSNFDNPNLFNFYLTDDLSLLDECIHNHSPLDPIYEDNYTTPTDEDYAETCKHPEEENVTVDS